MVDGPSAWPRATARAIAGRSYAVSKRLALVRMARRGAPLVVFSMGKTGSTAIARAVETATGRGVFQVFRLEPARLREAEQRYRRRRRETATDAPPGNPFPGAYHLWESDHLARHPPTARSPWTVITTVREPMAQAVSAFFHSLRQSGALTDDASIASLTDRFVTENWVRPPLRWFEREFRPAVGVDALGGPFDPTLGYAIVEHPAVRLLLLRQESFDGAPPVLASFLGLGAPVAVARRNDGATGPLAATYRRFLDEARLPPGLLAEAYDSDYALHFYGKDEIEQFRRRWSRT